MRYDWRSQGAYPRRGYTGDFGGDFWGYYRGRSQYWQPGLNGYQTRGRPYGREFDAYPSRGEHRRYDVRGGYAGRMLARGWGYRNDPYDRDWRDPRRERPSGWRGYDRGG